MYRISVREHFDAAHYLRGYGGKCENLHGHRFQVAVHLKAEKLNEVGIAYDFVELKEHLREILKRYDHICLNDLPPFDKLNPSSENIARTLWEELGQRLKDAPVTLALVEVWESPESCASFSQP